METILAYFPHLTDEQRRRFAALEELYRTWNERINVISRKDMEAFYLHHVLHSLAIARVCTFHTGARVLDVGCGGGLPGVPLAILFPETQFTLVDSIGKKIKVVEAVAEALDLKNLTAIHARAEQVDGTFDFVVSRAVTEMTPFVGWVWNKLRTGSTAGSQSNGILYLKGGDLTQELNATRKPYTTYPIANYFKEPFFETKQVVYLPR